MAGMSHEALCRAVAAWQQYVQDTQCLEHNRLLPGDPLASLLMGGDGQDSYAVQAGSLFKSVGRPALHTLPYTPTCLCGQGTELAGSWQF